jgi:DNA sulfur modification protein DndC
MYSGGKDSTTALIQVLEAAKSYKDIQVEVVYSDTRVEIPTLQKYAYGFLDYLKNNLGIKVHIFEPKLEDTFWTNLIGRGYPPPHQGFRWCTPRLKITPADKFIKSLPDKENTLVVTGVRFGESDARDARLNLSCQRGGECGQGVWYQHSNRLNVGYFAPIITWRECDVWDFLNLVAPSWGYPTNDLQDIYMGRETRFGCWVCTVVSQDRTMQKIVQTQPQYQPYLDFRNWLVEFGRSPKNRVIKPNGFSGRLTIDARQKILARLRKVERQLNTTLLLDDEYKLIRKYWRNPKYGDKYKE